MIYKWNEINYETFREIFNGFEQGEDWSKGKVLEVQNFFGISCSADKNESRIYFGKDINIMDWHQFNETSVGLLDTLSKAIGYSGGVREMLDNDQSLSMCVIEDGGPKIVPLFKNINTSDIIRESMFGDSSVDTSNFKYISGICDGIVCWYVKTDDGKYYVDLEHDSFKGISDKDRFIRCRSVDYINWENMMKSYKKGNLGEEWTKDDIKFEQIKLNLPKEVKDSINKELDDWYKKKKNNLDI